MLAVWSVESGGERSSGRGVAGFSCVPLRLSLLFGRRAEHDPFEYHFDWPSRFQVGCGFMGTGGLDHAETGLS